MDELAAVEELSAAEHGLATVVTLRADGSPHASVVNAGVLEHPTTGARVVGFVVIGKGRKLEHLRRDPRATVVFRSGWSWIAVDGTAEIIGPDDPHARVDEPRLAGLVREIYAAATGGTADDWAGIDAVAKRERHSAVLVAIQRVYPRAAT